MPDVRTVLDLIEAREGIRVDERRLPPSLRGKVGQLNALLMVFDQISLEVGTLKKRNRSYLGLLSVTLGVGVIGVAFGSMSLTGGFAGTMQVGLSLGSGLALFVVSYYIAVIERRIHALMLRKRSQMKMLNTELEDRLDEVYGRIISLPQTPDVHRY